MINKYKSLFCSCLLAIVIGQFSVNAQGVSISATTTTPDPSSILDISSHTQGVLISRMSTAERNLISPAAPGLQIFNTTSNCIEIYSGGIWQPVSCPCTAAPSTPGNITGSTSVCNSGQILTYSINAVANANSYVWTVTGGPAIIAGQGTTTIAVMFNTSGGTISVAATNNCGTSSSNSITATTVGGTPVLASAGSIALGGATIGGSPTASGGTGPYTYSWSPAIGLTGATTANPVAQCGGSSAFYQVVVTDVNGCSASSGVTVTRGTLIANAGSNQGAICGATIGGNPTATGGNPASYTYSWSPSTGLSGSTVANPFASPSSTTTYTVNVTDANGCTAGNSTTLTIGIAGTTVPVAATGTLQQWVAPANVSCIEIQAYGAQGGSAGGGTGGKGAYVFGIFTVTPGTTYDIVVGKQGASTGGGGGSFVWNASNSALLIAAAGGGGAGGGAVNGGDGSDTNTPTISGTGTSSASGGSGGNGGSGGSLGSNSSQGSSGGGAGWSGNGSAGVNGGSSSAGSGGFSPMNGAAGGNGGSNGGGGGYGGGGGGSIDGGGGGGYNGGGGGNGWNGAQAGGGGGGGSFIIGTATGTGATPGSRSGDGQVIISY